MFKQLKKVYPSLVLVNKETHHYSQEFLWFITENKVIFGIHRSELTKKDIALLLTFFEKYNPSLPIKTTEESRWYERIQKKTNEKPLYPYRFVYFSMQKNQIDPFSFKEAITELFGKTVPILWENETEGVIIEEIPLTDHQINYDQIIDILIADLSVQIKFYIGNIQDSFQTIGSYYVSFTQLGKFIFKMSNHKVINYIQAVPYLLLHQIKQQTKEQLASSILKKYLYDHEMLKTIETLLQHNLNVSETAKRMYMHRNSLQYRMDKFMNETGINLQKFDDAVAVKLALLAKKSLED